jgi:hypothetical protein
LLDGTAEAFAPVELVRVMTDLSDRPANTFVRRAKVRR